MRFYLFFGLIYLSLVALGYGQWLYSNREYALLLRSSLWALGLAVVGFFPLMGMPGMLVWGFYVLTGMARKDRPADQVWPTAIILTLVWPIGLPLGILLHQGGLVIGWAVPVWMAMGTGVLIWISIFGMWLRLQTKK